MEFRPLVADEIEQVAKLHKKLVYFIQRETADDYWDFKDLPTESIKKHLETFLNHPGRKIFIARNDDTVVGFIAGEVVPCHLPISNVEKIGYIAGAYVLPQYRGRGIMKHLERLMAAFFKELGINFMELYFLSRNHLARKSWQALGYQTYREQARKRI